MPAPDPLEDLAAALLPIVFSDAPPRPSRLRPVVIGRPRPMRRLPRRRWPRVALSPVAGMIRPPSADSADRDRLRPRR